MAKKKTSTRAKQPLAKKVVKEKAPKVRKTRSKIKVQKLKPQPIGPVALQNPKTRRLAIHAFCRQCIYDPGADGSWRKQVQACTATDCPLFNFRPMSIVAERKAAAKRKVK